MAYIYSLIKCSWRLISCLTSHSCYSTPNDECCDCLLILKITSIQITAEPSFGDWLAKSPYEVPLGLPYSCWLQTLCESLPIEFQLLLIVFHQFHPRSVLGDISMAAISCNGSQLDLKCTQHIAINVIGPFILGNIDGCSIISLNHCCSSNVVGVRLDPDSTQMYRT